MKKISLNEIKIMEIDNVDSIIIEKLNQIKLNKDIFYLITTNYDEKYIGKFEHSKASNKAYSKDKFIILKNYFYSEANNLLEDSSYAIIYINQITNLQKLTAQEIYNIKNDIILRKIL